MALDDKPYVGQQLVVRLDSEDANRPNVPPLDLSTAVSLEVRYNTPGAETPTVKGATHDPGNVSVMEATLSTAETTAGGAGDWVFWGWADFGTGLILIGESILVRVYAEGE